MIFCKVVKVKVSRIQIVMICWQFLRKVQYHNIKNLIYLWRRFFQGQRIFFFLIRKNVVNFNKIVVSTKKRFKNWIKNFKECNWAKEKVMEKETGVEIKKLIYLEIKLEAHVLINYDLCLIFPFNLIFVKLLIFN